MPPIYLGDAEITALYLGDTEVTAAYLGDVLVYSATPPPTVLRPQRAGASDQYLQDSGGQLTDSGALDYWYDGTGGSDAVLVDALGADGLAVESGDAVSVYGWDAQQQVGITAVGLPSLQRDSGWAGAETSASDYCEYSLGIAGSFTLAIHFHSPASLAGNGALIRAWDGSIQHQGHGMYRVGSDLIFQTRASNTTVRANTTLPLTADTEYVAIGTYNGSTGAITLRLYEVGGGAPATDSDTGATVNNQANDYNIGGTVGGITDSNADIAYVRYYTGVLSTGAQDDIADDTDRTGGGTLYHDFVGLRSLVYLESEGPTGTTLLYPGGTGGAVTVAIP